MQAATIFHEALQLSPLDKAKLLDLLIQSLSESGTVTEHEQEWVEHIERICSAIDSKHEAKHSFETVLSELNQ